MKCFKVVIRYSLSYSYRNAVIGDGSIYVFADSAEEAARLASAHGGGDYEEIQEVKFIGKAIGRWCGEADPKTIECARDAEASAHGVIARCLRCNSNTFIRPGDPIQCGHGGCGGDSATLLIKEVR